MFSCNPTRDRWINRKWHTLTGHYNIYFNAEQKLLDAKQQIEKSHVDDFNKILDVLQVGSEQSAKTAGNLLDEANKKFAGTIQLHTIGTYTDDAYLGIAKCQYYKRDYYSAIESFQFVNNKYKDKGFKFISLSWIAKCYVGLDKLNEAESVIGILGSEAQIPKQDIVEVYSTIADINVRLSKYSSAIQNLKKALTGRVNKDQKIRFNYILGQLFLQAGQKPEALFHFNKVISFIPPYDFAFNANINIAGIYDLNNKRSVNNVRRNLKRMLRDEKNLDYLDQIYFELAKLEQAQKNIPPAINYFQLSAAKSTKNRIQKSKAYHELAKMFFTEKDYKMAQAYYDSTVMSLEKSDKDYPSINRTKIVLTDLINNLNVFETEDSLQSLAKLSRDAINRKIDSWMEEVRKNEEIKQRAAKKNAKIAASMANNQSQLAQTDVKNFNPGASSTAWYFYNPQLVATGAADFFNVRKWGQRKNEDFWRIAAKEKSGGEDDQNQTDVISKKDSSKTDTKDSLGLDAKTKEKELKENSKATEIAGGGGRNDWIKNVPFTDDQKKKSNEKMIEALKNLGKIYYDKLENQKESLKYFDELQKRFPESKYEPDALYYMHKSKFDLKNLNEADKYKNTLISKYPENPYALLLQNKAIATPESDSNKEVEKLYERMYNSYQEGNFALAKQLKSEADKNFPGNKLKPKYELLYSMVIGKTESVQAFKNSLTDIVKEYPKTDVAERAQIILNYLNKEERKSEIIAQDTSLKQSEFDLETETAFYYVFALKNDKADFTDFVAKLSNYNDKYASTDKLRVNAMMSKEGYQLLLAREFPNFNKALDYYKGIEAVGVIKGQLKVNEPYVHYVISVSNFKNVLKDSKIEKFKQFFDSQAKAANQIKK